MNTTDKLKEAALLPALYETQYNHWWSVGMRAITHALLDTATIPNAPILEIGVGGGAFAAELANRFPTRQVWGTDLNPTALQHARRHPLHFVWQGDLHHLPIADNKMGAVLALDVFDQKAVDLRASLQEAHRVLAPEGIVLMRVSAYDWLRGPHDVAFGTGRRYSAKELRDALTSVGLTPVRVSYANTLLLLPAIAVRLSQRQGTAEVKDQLETAAPLAWMFKTILRSEAQFLRYFNAPAGLSLYAIAKK
jgi:SAM-dependent methyltransferase